MHLVMCLIPYTQCLLFVVTCSVCCLLYTCSYMQWQRMERDKSESQQIFTQNQEQLAESALQQFQSVLTDPTGVWDMFIPNQVHLLISLG